MGNHEYCENCVENNFHYGRPCDPKKVATINKLKAAKKSEEDKRVAIQIEVVYKIKAKNPSDRFSKANDMAYDLYRRADDLIKAAARVLGEQQTKCKHIWQGGFMYSSCVKCGITDL